MDLRTTYLGLELAHPFVPGASPLAADLDSVKRLEDAGAAAIVMPSLFEEQIARADASTFLHSGLRGESFAEALLYFPSPDRFAFRPDSYLRHVAAMKRAVACPVIASLNGTTLGGWLHFGESIEQAGADALELNVYAGPPDFDESGQEVEDRIVDMLRELKSSVRIPVAVKLSPFFASLPHLARRLHAAGADGLVLFNRFYQGEMDAGTLETNRHPPLSGPHDLPLRLHWTSVLSGRVGTSLAVSGGVHGALDAIKALMAGADVVQVVSALLAHGPEHLRRVRDDAVAWMTGHGYASLAPVRGCMDFESCPDPAVYERANYMLSLQSWRGR